eukprot:Hpha_TRINITY_DN16226_c0_g2::TRINITY_DN16226_c0_g2_i1::g.15094::m.15094
MAILAGLTAAAVAAQLRVPGGRVVDSECIVRLPNNAHYNADAPQVPAGCSAGNLSAPQVQIYAADVHFESQDPLTGFTADWVVPPLPEKYRFQVVYFWPGFKSQQPEMGYPVLQPVLQYGEHGGAWQLQSWFVDARDSKYPVVTAPAISVKPGDRLTSYMSLSADQTTWTVSGTNKGTGETSALNVAFTKAGDCQYNYAMLVNENVNVNENCDLMPASTNVTFTNVTVNGVVPKWTTRADCAGNAKCDCKNAATVDATTGDVTLSWQP